jgi:ATP-dependent Clp protease ATP-binding subunit ClpB
MAKGSQAMTDIQTTETTKKPVRVPSPNYLIRGTDYLNERAPDFKLIGRQGDLDKIYGILMRPSSNNVLLTGLRGVGVSSMVFGLQAAKSDPNTPFDMINKHYYILETDRLFSLDNKEDIEKAFKAALTTLHKDPNSVLVIEDLGDFIEAATNSGCKHFINMMMHELGDRSGNQALFLCRDDNLNTVYKAHSDMHKLFTLHEMQEPSPEELRAILKATGEKIAKREGIKVDQAAVDTALDMTSRFHAKDASLDRAQPERAITLLERAMVSYRMDAHRNPPEIVEAEAQLKAVVAALAGGKITKELQGQSKEELESRNAVLEAKIGEMKAAWEQTQKQILKLSREQRRAENGITERQIQIEGRREFLKKQDEKEAARIKRMSEKGTIDTVTAEGINEADDFKDEISESGYELDPEIKQLVAEIETARGIVEGKQAEYAAIAEKINSTLELNADHILSEFSRLSGIPANKLNQDEREKLLNLEPTLSNRVYGQEPAISGLVNAVMISKTGLKEPNLPDGSFFFLGPSGTGKTESAKALTEALFDDQSNLIRINMSEYQEKNAVAKLIGAPPGYEGFEVGGYLTNAVRKKPYSVVLFDEVEKGHPDVMDLLLQVLSDAELGDNLGRKVSFKNCIVIVTSNIGSEYFLDPNMSYEEAKDRAMKDLDQKFRPEFLNRFNGKENIIMFNRLELPQLERIARRELASLNKKVAPKGLSVGLEDGALADMCRDFYAPAVGARRIPALFNSRIYPDIAKTILRTPDARGAMQVDYNSETKTFTVNPPQIVIANENDLRREIAGTAAGGFRAAVAKPS